MPKTRKLVSNYTDMYEAFPHKDKVTRHEYRLILKMFNTILRKTLIYTGSGFKLPYGIGNIGITSSPGSRKIFDYQHYKETGEKRNLVNLHTEGKVLKVVLRATPNRLHFEFRTRCLYKFKAHRHMLRELAAAVKSVLSVHKFLTYETYFD